MVRFWRKMALLSNALYRKIINKCLYGKMKSGKISKVEQERCIKSWVFEI